MSGPVWWGPYVAHPEHWCILGFPTTKEYLIIHNNQIPQVNKDYLLQTLVGILSSPLMLSIADIAIALYELHPT